MATTIKQQRLPPKTENVAFRLDRETRLALQRAANRDQRTVSDWLGIKVTELLASESAA